MTRKLTREEFIQKAEERHGEGRYDYSKVVYVGSHAPVEIICLVCGIIFWQRSSNHIHLGHGCPDCGAKRAAQIQTHDKAKFRTKGNAKHGDGRYDYSKVVYVNSCTPVEIICLVCKSTFWQAPDQHTSLGHGCPDCGVRRVALALTHNEIKFMTDGNITHGDGRYDYSKVVYVNNCTPVEIICLACGNTFWKRPVNHIHHGSGCPFCRQSKGEAFFTRLLTESKLNFTAQQKYPKQIGQKAYDFLAHHQDKQLLLEFDGIQHFEPVEFFGGSTQFVKQQASDLIKTLFAIEQGIPLLRLDYLLSNSDLAACFNEALTSLDDFDLILSDQYLYRDLIAKIYDQYPTARILCLGDSTPQPHDSWDPEAVDHIQTHLPDFDLTRSLSEQDADELWNLIGIFGYTDHATEESSAAWLQQTLEGQTVAATASLQAALDPDGTHLLRYIQSAC